MVHAFDVEESVNQPINLGESRNAGADRDKSGGHKGGIWSPGDTAEKLDQEMLMSNGPLVGNYVQEEDNIYGSASD